MSKKAFVILMFLVAGAATHADDFGDRIRDCAAIEDNTTRLACFDGLVMEAPAAPVAPTVPAAPAAPVTPVAEVSAPPPAPDSLGAERLRHKNRAVEAEEDVNVTATVTRCEERSDGRYVFYFDNGQVWRQSNNDRSYFRDCNFDVTITKDFFGYKMQQSGEKRRIRIKRMK
jgi:hypothetical protein